MCWLYMYIKIILVIMVYVWKSSEYKSCVFEDLYIFWVYIVFWLVWSFEYDYVVYENELFGLIYKSIGRINYIFNGWFFKIYVLYFLILYVFKIKDIIIMDVDVKFWFVWVKDIDFMFCVM